MRGLFSLLVVGLLTACTARIAGDDVSVRSKPVTIDIGPGGGSSFCPPGQAKKGNC